MGRRTKYIVPGVKIEGIADRGRAIGRGEDGQVLFVQDVVPGDIVDVLVLRKKKGYLQGVPNQFIQLSPDRQKPHCQHFEDCGGCKWQHFKYEGQLQEKQMIVEDAMRRIGKISVGEINSIVAAPDQYHYRNKMEFSFSSRRWKSKKEIQDTTVEVDNWNALGLHPPGFFDKVVDIQSCHLMHPRNDEIRNTIRDYAHQHNLTFYDPVNRTGLLRNLIIRHTTLEEWMLVLSFAHQSKKIRPMLEALQTKFEFTSLHYVINSKYNDSLYDQEIICHTGAPYIREKLGDLTFMIRPKSFFQTNSVQAEKLYEVAKLYAQLEKHETVYDLYTGTGSIALYVSDQCAQVVGVEEIEDAIHDARHNAKSNKIENAHFYVGDVKNVFTPDLIEKHGRPDVIITDPPRAGMHEEVTKSLLQSEPSRIVYISCNPATQARDLQILNQKYRVEKMQPIDMFPHTNHIENIALLVKSI